MNIFLNLKCAVKLHWLRTKNENAYFQPLLGNKTQQKRHPVKFSDYVWILHKYQHFSLQILKKMRAVTDRKIFEFL